MNEINMQKNWKRFTMIEISKHNTENDGWFVYNGSVFNASPHLKEIKSMKTSTYLAIMRVLGTDCTDEMGEISHSDIALAQIYAYKIGEVE